VNFLIIVLFLTVIFLFPSVAWGKQAETGNTRILVISSYSPIKEGENHTIASFVRYLNEKSTASISVE